MTGHVNLEIVSAGTADLDALARLHALCFDQAWPASEFDRLLAMPGAFLLIARDDAGAVGFLLGRVASDEAEIVSIGVAPAHRRRGIAARLVARAHDHLRGCGALSLVIEVDQDNSAAVGLYLNDGFESVGRRSEYYKRPDGTRADALVMRRALPCA